MAISHYDIGIVGAGVTGLVLASLLAQKTELSIVVLDAGDFPKAPADVRFSPRVSALNIFSQNVLKSLDLWDKISKNVAFYSKMHVWDACENIIDFDCYDIGENQLGCIVANDVLRYYLLDFLKMQETVTLLPNSPAVSLSQGREGVTIELKRGQCLGAALLVAADGARSWVREQAGFELREWEYGHTALIAHVRTELSHQDTAQQKFLQSGPLAFLPLKSENWCSIVWSTSPEHASELMTLSDDEFCGELGMAFDCKLGRILESTQRFSFPLKMRHSKAYLRDNIVLIGDAAHTIHPLAGQGLNIGIQDSVELACQLERGATRTAPVTARKYLRAYERARKAENWQMILMMECLKHIFASRQSYIQMLLSFGLSFTQKNMALKTLFLKAAEGRNI